MPCSPPSAPVAQAEGIMCAQSTINGLPPCGDPYLLQTKLRQEWQSDAVVQSDCCDSINSIWRDHHLVPTMMQALNMTINAGLQASYAVDAANMSAEWALALSTGVLTEDQLNAAVSRAMLTRFRLGEFDTSNPSNPLRGPWDASLLDGPQHRALAREAAAASMVLLRNNGSLLPFNPATFAASNVAVIGPFSDCSGRTPGYGSSDR